MAYTFSPNKNLCFGESIQALSQLALLSLAHSASDSSPCFLLYFPSILGLSLLSPFCSLTAPLPTFSPTYLILGVILLLQHGGHLILKETELLIYLLQEHFPLGRVQKAALDQHLRSTRERLRCKGQRDTGDPFGLPIYSSQLLLGDPDFPPKQDLRLANSIASSSLIRSYTLSVLRPGIPYPHLHKGPPSHQSP